MPACDLAEYRKAARLLLSGRGMLLTILFGLAGAVGVVVLLVEVRAALRHRAAGRGGPKRD
jgi:hypothetical protein